MCARKRRPDEDEGSAAPIPPIPGFLILADLAERWSVSLTQAKAIVREEQVPFISLRAVDMRINWAYVCFKPEDVAAWERSRQRVAPGPDPDALQPATVLHRILDVGGRSRGKR